MYSSPYMSAKTLRAGLKQLKDTVRHRNKGLFVSNKLERTFLRKLNDAIKVTKAADLEDVLRKFQNARIDAVEDYYVALHKQKSIPGIEYDIFECEHCEGQFLASDFHGKGCPFCGAEDVISGESVESLNIEKPKKRKKVKGERSMSKAKPKCFGEYDDSFSGCEECDQMTACADSLAEEELPESTPRCYGKSDKYDDSCVDDDCPHLAGCEKIVIADANEEAVSGETEDFVEEDEEDNVADDETLDADEEDEDACFGKEFDDYKECDTCDDRKACAAESKEATDTTEEEVPDEDEDDLEVEDTANEDDCFGKEYSEDDTMCINDCKDMDACAVICEENSKAKSRGKQSKKGDDVVVKKVEVKEKKVSKAKTKPKTKPKATTKAAKGNSDSIWAPRKGSKQEKIVKVIKRFGKKKGITKKGIIDKVEDAYDISVSPILVQRTVTKSVAAGYIEEVGKSGRAKNYIWAA